MKDYLYIDGEQLENGNIGVVYIDEKDEQVEVKFAGVSVINSDLTEEEHAIYHKIFQTLGIRFLFGDNQPKISFYAVPQIFIFATGSEREYFASLKKPPSMDEDDTPIYYIYGKNCYFKISDCLKSFFQTILYNPDWKTSVVEKKLKDKLPNNIDCNRKELVDLLGLEKNHDPYSKTNEDKEELILYSSYEEAAKLHRFLSLNHLFKE